MIQIFTKDYCPYCVLAKELFTSLWVEFSEIDVTNDTAKLMEIVQVSGMRTVPQIFNGEVTSENLLWGYSDVKSLHDQWKLLELLK